MSKRNSVGASNTLFNYFTKTPPSNKKTKLDSDGEGVSKSDSPVIKNEIKKEKKKRERQESLSPNVQNTDNDSDSDMPIAPKRRKRIRINPMDSDDSDVENKDNKNEDTKETKTLGKRLQDSFKYEPNESPKGNKSKNPPPKTLVRTRGGPRRGMRTLGGRGGDLEGVAVLPTNEHGRRARQRAGRRGSRSRGRSISQRLSASDLIQIFNVEELPVGEQLERPLTIKKVRTWNPNLESNVNVHSENQRSPIPHEVQPSPASHLECNVQREENQRSPIPHEIPPSPAMYVECANSTPSTSGCFNVEVSIDEDNNFSASSIVNRKHHLREQEKIGRSSKRVCRSLCEEGPQLAVTSSVAASSSSDRSTPKLPELQEKPAVADEGNWTHCKLEWLKPDKLRDACKRRPDHPDYDPSTLYVPPEYMKTQTPAHQQWWEMKSSHFDCVLLFKVGKFYELYHMDAAVGVNELGFSYMKGEFAHSGFPESAYARMASTLVSKGYKVARVEQTETPDMMQERCKKMHTTKKTDKVVRREICQVSVKGAQVCGLQDTGPSEPNSAYMFAVAEEETNGRSNYGVCFVDTSIGQFHIGQFKDDKHSSRLLTTLAHYPPALIIFDRKSTSPRTSKLLSTHCHNARREPISFWSPENTLKTLAEKYYKTNADGDWPEGIKPFLHEGDALGLTPAPNCYLAVKALGGCVSYLTDCLLDIQILGMSQFTTYAPPDILNSTILNNSVSEDSMVESKWTGGSTMVLDAITLRNLRIVQDEGCLYDRLNFCSTAMGKRLLYQWVCSPSCNLSVIKERQEAVKVLFDNQEICQDAKNILTTLPDLERLLAKVHALGNLRRSKTHPDSRAIFYEEKTYSKRKVLDFIAVLNGFTAALRLVELFSGVDADLPRRITQFSRVGKFPDYRDTLKFFKESFNQSEAEKEGRILPGEGVDQEYDNVLKTIKDIEDELKEYLVEQEKYFKCRLSYVGSDKKRYQIEVPQNAASKAGSDYHFESARKGYKRFSTYETKDLLARMMAAEDQKTNVLKDLSRRIFEKFSSHHNQWETAVQCMATLDILLAFTEFARQQNGDVCLPQITFEEGGKPYMNIVEGRHPCIAVNDFIPNDTKLGVDNAALLLLTGPNMGGKSTLMRQAALITVLAHLGSYVPATECSLSLVDRIFTRLGASDDILSGQSTFLLEMNETAAIVRHATLHSLVLLDELGRGTSTYDGTAIASGVCAELASRGCRVIFSTHYHSLVHHLATHPGVVLGHMACMVETEELPEDSEDAIPEETITFLYKLSPGACPKSYGFNAARLAGIPRDITRRAQRVAHSLEREATAVRAFRDLLKVTSAKDLRQLLAGLTI